MLNRSAVPFVLAVLAWLSVLPGCAPQERQGGVASTAAPEIENVRRQQTLDDCPEQLAPCASITLEYVELAGATPALQTAVLAFLDSTVFAPIDDQPAGSGPAAGDSLMRQFLEGYREFSESFPDAPGAWSIRRSARSLWNDSGVLSLEFSEESYTGGAHPNTASRLISFAVTDGRRLSLADVFDEGYEEPVRALGERAFRVLHGLGPGDDLVAAGFWFEDGRFRLGDNYAVTADGLRIHFNAYEIAPYSMGPTDLLLPRADLARWARPGGPLAPQT